MKLLVIGLDRSIAERGSRSSDRQRAYYAGWDVDIVILATGESVMCELNPGLRIHITGGSNKAVALWRGLRLSRRIARRQIPKVVSAQDTLWSGFVALSASYASGVHLHLQDHSGFFARSPSTVTEWFFRPFAIHYIQRAQRIRTVSERGAKGLEKFGIPRERIDVIPIATDLSRFISIPPIDASRLNVLCIARLEPEKGVDVLLNAWKTVCVSRPSARLQIVGGGKLRQNLEAQMNALGVASSVDFIGRQKDVVPYLAWSSLVVQPSCFEGWGLSIIEAAASGRPVVMTNVGCAGEIICDGVSGRVVSIGDASAFARAILEVSNDPKMTQQYAEAAKKRVKSLPTPAQTVEHIRQSFERAAE